MLQDQVEELDALAAKTAAAATQLEALRQTSVLEDCFHIWCALPVLPPLSPQAHRRNPLPPPTPAPLSLRILRRRKANRRGARKAMA